MSSIPNGSYTFSGMFRGRTIPLGTSGASFGISRWSSDATGTTSVTFSGVKAGSEIRVYLSDMTEVAGIESCVDNQVLSWGTYASGNPNNNVRIVIISLDNKILDFNYVSIQGSQSIPIFQEEDPWFKDPV